MIVEIEAPRPSCRTALDYNERKVARGVAELVGWANLRGTGRQEVRDLFDRYERSRYYVAEKSFHASVNPSCGDRCGQEEILAFIDGMMDRLGLGAQPRLVYRHFDTGREHYHVVSVRVDAGGHKINNYYEKRKAGAYMREVASRFGFTVAERGEGTVRGGEELSSDAAPGGPCIPRFDPAGEVTAQLRSLLARAMEFDFGSIPQLVCVLSDMGVRAEVTGRGTHRRFTLQGMDRHGVACTGRVNERSLGEGRLYDLAVRTAEANALRRPVRRRERSRVRGLVISAFTWSRSEAHFRNILRLRGIGVHMITGREDGELRGILFTDHRTGSVVASSQIRGAVSPADIREALESGRWKVEPERRRAPAGTPGRKAPRPRFLSVLVKAAFPASGGSSSGAAEGKRPRRDGHGDVPAGDLTDRRYVEKVR